MTIRDCIFKKGVLPAMGADASFADTLYPGDWNQIDCRQKLELAQKNGTELEVYQQIMSHTHPRLQFYFLSRFPLTCQFLRARTSYVGTLSINSLLGHILGIGDRHLKNLLLCYHTGSLAYIDFGYMFEIGRILNIPERVPFRLTRELLALVPKPSCIWDSFLSDCLSVLELLRDHSRHISSAISIILDDVLAYWRHGENTDVKRKGPNENRLILDPLMDVSKNMEARKALMRVRHKLCGREFSPLSLFFMSPRPPSDTEVKLMPQLPDPEGVSKEVQLKILLSWATNDKLLAQMFVGWTPWI
eukprot:Gregarina_sp_Poly_1__4317@NODE_2342_length_2258_cov_155_502967_g1497_i0_p1_GENE_NODE_2342_length_2258_cov_155_502967_g1497_i0NODE_2342_length_2258_cov_155_502967_g1497_i0_p1_ORF_typecomplete_len303_score24_86PI3_PI4_kinase/PF00454_27/2_4e29FATC/PF02260_20/4_1e06_NODE_2342_length_2258_cov_155_502967_g1497_i05431451